MAKLNNPAARLLALLQKAKQIPDNQRGGPALDVWSILLTTPKSYQPLLLKRYGGVMELPMRIKEEIESIEGINHELYLRWIHKVQAAFNAHYLTGAFTTFVTQIDDTTLLGLEHCADILSTQRPECEIENSELESLRKQVEELISEIKNNDVDQDLKTFLLKHLLAIRNAIEEYTLFGSKPMETAFGQSISAVFTEPQESVKASNCEAGQKFWKIVGRVNKLLETGEKVTKLTYGVLKLIGLSTGSESS